MALVLSDLQELPEGYIPLATVAIVECLTPDGTKSLVLRCNNETPMWTELGMIQAALNQRSKDLLENWEED